MNNNNSQQRIWQACLCIAVALVALALSPWTLAPGAVTPVLGGLPRVLWVGFGVAFGLIVVALIAARSQANDDNGQTQDR